MGYFLIIQTLQVLYYFTCTGGLPIILTMVIVLTQANIRLIKAGLKLVGAMCSCGSDVASVLIVSCSLFFFLSCKLCSINLLQQHLKMLVENPPK